MTWPSCKHCKSALGSSAVEGLFLEGKASKKLEIVFILEVIGKKYPRWQTGGYHSGPSGVSWKRDPKAFSKMGSVLLGDRTIPLSYGLIASPVVYSTKNTTNKLLIKQSTKPS